MISLLDAELQQVRLELIRQLKWKVDQLESDNKELKIQISELKRQKTNLGGMAIIRNIAQDFKN